MGMRKQVAGRGRHAAEELDSWLALRAEHGLSYRQLSQLCGIPATTLQGRARRQRRGAPQQGISARGKGRKRARTEPESAMEFVELVPAPAPRSEGTFEVVLENARRVMVPSDFDPEALRRLLSVVGERC